MKRTAQSQPEPYAEKPVQETAVGKKALVLAGGGMAGIAYELGALHALDRSLVDFSVNDFDIFVGTSAGASLSALLANGFSPGMILHAVQGNHKKTRPFERQDLWNMDFGRFLRAGSRIPRRLWRTGQRYMSDVRDSGLFGSLWVLLDLLPSSLYDSEGLEAYLRDLIHSLDGSNNFDELDKELDIIATRLDTGQRVVFNRESNAHNAHSDMRIDVHISEAVAASSAVPALYKPVRLNGVDYVDGAVRGNASIDVAVERGATTVICINPIVPLDGRNALPEEGETATNGAAAREASMQAIVAQVMRTRMHAGLHYHVKHLSVVYPEVDFYLIEPNQDDPVMSAPNLMRYGGRFQIGRRAFETVSLELAQDQTEWEAIWRRHDVAVRPGLNEAELAQLAEAWPPQPVAQLSETLTCLDETLDQQQEVAPFR